MDCNKDEAIRAKELAERKLAEMDTASAKKFALKAQTLYPELDGVSQLLATLEIYISAEKRINGEVDWYGVLGVQPFADDDTIRKHYRKLALILHPDKNKSVGADGAFKILSEAWSMLSDKAKRIAYDQKRNLRVMYANGFNGKTSSSVPTSQNGFRNFSNINIFNARDQRTDVHSIRTPGPAPHPVTRNTFWTICSSCKVQFEYLRNYLNQNLHCVNCHRPFLAVETPAPPINGVDTYWNSCVRRQNIRQVHNTWPPRFSGIQSSARISQLGAFSRSGIDVRAASSTSQAAADAQISGDQLKRVHEEAEEATTREDSICMKHAFQNGAGLDAGSSGAGSSSAVKAPKKKRRIDAHGLNKHGKEITNEAAMETGGSGLSRSQKTGSDAGRANIAGICRPNRTRELSQLETRDMLMSKAKKEILRKLNEWSSASISNSSDKSKTSDIEMNIKKQTNGEAVINRVIAGANKSAEYVDIKSSIRTKMPSIVNSDIAPATKEADPMSMSVPDSDFHDFDRDRAEKSFGDNQVWAAYDNDDGMPRYYAMIHSVISLRPFKMRISWLNSKSNRELGPLNWIGSGFYKTSGDFWIGKYEVNKSLNSFSHKVKWSKGRKGAIQIYPTKGDVWALYRNWSPDWNEHTRDEVIHKYDMVQVLEDFNEQKGVTVAPLVKVAGFKTVFQLHSEPSKTMTIPREEMFRFSHQVPSHLLTGQEGPNAPKDCLELDPAATPLELLKVLSEAQIKETEKIIESATGEIASGNLRSSEEESLVENGKPVEPNNIIAEVVDKAVVGESTEEGGKDTENPVMLVYRRRRRERTGEARGTY